MLMKFSVENYRGFKDRVELDLSKIRNYTFHSEYIRDGIINKCMVVGRNGCGKTNFGLAMFDIVSVLTDYQIDMKQKDRFRFLNGDSDQPYATFRYVFKHGGSEIEYEYRKSDPDNIVYERMSVDDTLIFMRDGNLTDYSGLKDYGAGNLHMDIGDGPLSVLRYVANNTNQSKDSTITGIMGFVKGMLYVGSIQEGNGYIGLTRGSEEIQDYIMHNGLKEDFNSFLKDLAEVDVSLDVIGGDGIPEKLVLRTKNKALDFDHSASSGTRMLMLHYYWMKHMDDITFMYLDGFDAHYHFELAERILLLLSSDRDVQCLFTSHNTSLVTNRIFRPDCYMYLDSRGITSLPDLTDREIRGGHNLEKLLRGGEFDE